MKQGYKPLVAERHSEVVALLRYEPDTGLFFWRINRKGPMRAGDRAGSLGTPSDGGQQYWRVFVFGKHYSAHRLAWFYVHGRWPSRQLDHINGCRQDNRIANLREVGFEGNAQNRLRARRDSSSGLIGAVATANGTWAASIGVDKRRIHLGTFKTPEEASAAYIKAKRQVHSTCSI